MCTIAAAGLVLALGSTALTAYEQNQQVKAENAQRTQAAEEGAKLADANFKQEAGQVRLRDQQQASAASQELIQNAKAAAQARATARVSAGEAGASGVSVDNLISDFYSQEAQYNNSVGQNLTMSQLQSTQELMGLRSGAIDRTIASRQPLLNRPSYLAAGIQAGGQVLDFYNRYRYTNSTPSGRTGG